MYAHKLPRKFVSIFSLVFGLLLFVVQPSRVAAASPAESAFFCNPDTAALEAATGNKFNHCGQVGIWFKVFNEFLSGPGESYEDYLNRIDKQSSTPATSYTIPKTQKGVGLLGMVRSLDAAILDQKPASGIAFAMDTAQKIITPNAVYAADATPYFPGTGWALLLPIQAFWSWAVTLSYGFMIILIIIVAIALMFRQKLDGKTVVTLQNAIPNIVIAMIMIILSYPISGLFIDAITLGSNIFYGLVFNAASPGRVVLDQGLNSRYVFDTNSYEPGIGFGPTDPATITNPDAGRQNELRNVADPNARGLYADDPKLNVLKVKELIGINKLGLILDPGCQQSQQATEEISGALVPLLGLSGRQYQYCNNDNWYEVTTTILGQLNVFTGQNLTFGLVIGEIINFLFGMVLLVVSLKIGWKLFKKFAILTVYPVISPFIFASIAIPGTGTKLAWDYINNLAAASLNFIVTYILFVTAIILSNPAFHNSIPNIGQGVYNPPLIGSIVWQVTEGATSRLFSDIGIIFQLIAAVILLNIPNVLESIDKRFKVSGELPKFLKDARAQYDTSFKTVTGITSGAIESSPFLKNTVGKAGKNIVGGIANAPGSLINNTLGRAPIIGGAAKAAGNTLNRELGRAADPVARLFTSGSAPISNTSEKRVKPYKYSLDIVAPLAAIVKNDAATDMKVKAGEYGITVLAPGAAPAAGGPAGTSANLEFALPISADIIIKLDEESKEFLGRIDFTDHGSGVIGTIKVKSVSSTGATVDDVANIVLVKPTEISYTPAAGKDIARIAVQIILPARTLIAQTYLQDKKIITKSRGVEKDLSVRVTLVS